MRSTTYALALVALIISSLISLVSAQAAAGGGAGVATTYTGVQIISGYTPPQSTPIPVPTVPRGTILTTIPGYGNGSNAGGSGGQLNQGSGMGGSSSGALSLFTSAHFMASATSATTFACVAVVAAAAVLL